MEFLPARTVGATLAFRFGEGRTYYQELPDTTPNLYAVCLHRVPTLPEPAYPDCRPLAVLALQLTRYGYDVEETWGWTHLDPDAKAAIGEDLEDMNAEPDRWYYMVIVDIETN